MLNYIWLALIVIAVITGALTGQIENVTTAALDNAGTAVNIALGLVGIMALWLGIMKIAEEAGIVAFLARIIRPLARRLFPEIPADHPAIGAIFLNLSASWLGLGNAATPLGIKAMEHLQSLNPQKDTATNSMIMFLALNTASITFVPMTMIAVRAQMGSSNPAEIIGTTIFSSMAATITAIITVKLFITLSGGWIEFRSQIRKNWRTVVVLAGVILLVVFMLVFGLMQKLLNFLPPESFKQIVLFISTWTIPVLLVVIPVAAVFKKLPVYELFIEGAKEGFHVAVRIIPYLVAILVAIGMLRASGALDFFVTLIKPFTDLLGMPGEALPPALMRPLSGSGTLGLVTELLKTHGPDSFIGRLSSTIYGCTETTFYVIAVYFGAVQIKKTRFAVPAGLIADLAGVLAALFICRMVF
ncbi:spore maturation protein [candidate division KSB1 bacterium]|nr:spore maturation protein [candidate division KSB1 bacterium]